MVLHLSLRVGESVSNKHHYPEKTVNVLLYVYSYGEAWYTWIYKCMYFVQRKLHTWIVSLYLFIYVQHNIPLVRKGSCSGIHHMEVHQVALYTFGVIFVLWFSIVWFVYVCYVTFQERCYNSSQRCVTSTW